MALKTMFPIIRCEKHGTYFSGKCPTCHFENIEVNMSDLVNNPPHYNSHPSGVECIEITEHLNFCLGNAIKYIWRAGEKGNAVEDLEKAAWYIKREIERIQRKCDTCGRPEDNAFFTVENGSFCSIECEADWRPF